MRMLAPGLAALAIIAISLHGSFVRAQAVDQESSKRRSRPHIRR